MLSPDTLFTPIRDGTGGRMCSTIDSFGLMREHAGNTPVGTVTARDGDSDPVTYSLSGDHAG